MSKIDYSALDGQNLRLFLAVLEEGSVTGAAARLGVTQSAVSHGLDKLRAIVADPLFVRSGRGIVATAHARALAAKAHDLLDGMKAFASGAHFDPASARLSLTVAANDFQRDLLLPPLLAKLAAETERVDLRVIPSGLPSGDMLREGRCDLLITPRPPEGSDVFQRLLFRDRYVCFYDAAMRAAPRSLAAYFKERHITVVYPDNERLEFDRRLAAKKIVRDIAVQVPNFYGVPAFLRGTGLLASVPSLLRHSMMREFSYVMIALKDGVTDLPMYMVWHQRFQSDPAHLFLRGLLEQTARDVVGGRTSRERSDNK
ncbi:MAG: LysR family transcriptional regulator [Pseudolabrys sp.]|jgi:DNA-binding transcriptional LysR family regulator